MTTEVSFKRKTFVILGRLDAMTKDEAWMKVQNLGGYVSSTPRPSSDYIVLGKSPGATKFALVAKVGKPTLTEAEFLAAVAAEEARLAAERGEVPLNDAIADFRGLVYDAPTSETWLNITRLLDQCAPDALELAVDYVEQHISAWPDPTAMGQPQPLALHMPPPLTELRTPPQSWLTDLLQGRDSPKFRLLRRLALSVHKLTGTVAMRALDHPSLVNLRQLDLGEDNKMSLAFFKKLRQTERLPALDTLVLRHLIPSYGDALCGDHNLHNLRYVTLAHPDRYADSAEHLATYNALFKADWWARIEGLCCVVATGRGAIWPNLSAYPALAANLDRLPRLQHLMLGDDFGLDTLIEADAFARIKHLSLYCCNNETAALAIDALARAGHTVEHLDLSRAIFSSHPVRPGPYSIARHNTFAATLAMKQDVGAVRTVTWCDRVAEPDLRRKLTTWASNRDITLQNAPW